MQQSPPANPTDQALARLQRLEGFLQQDSSNVTLLGDAFDTAMTARAMDRAAFHLAHGKVLRPNDLVWVERELGYCIATSDADRFEAVAAAAEAKAAGDSQWAAALLRARASHAFGRGDFAQAAGMLEKLLSNGGRPSTAVAMMWLRALHRSDRAAEALAWSAQAERQGRLVPEAAGIAALIALDEGDLEHARQWTALGAASEAPTLELLLVAGQLALLDGRIPEAVAVCEQAAAMSAADARVRACAGMAQLLAARPQRALEHLQAAQAIDPQDPDAASAMGWAWLVLGETGHAKAQFERAIESGGSPELTGALAAVAVLSGDKAEGATLIAQAEADKAPEALCIWVRSLLNGEGGGAAAVLPDVLMGRRG
jgi:Flp pilus assembly protein TadD